VQLVNLVIGLFQLLPWWAAMAVLAGLVLGTVLYARRLMGRMLGDITRDIVAQGARLSDAVVSVHSVELTQALGQSSQFDSRPGDEDYDPDLDGNWSEEDGRFYWVDATIAPQQPDATWTPSELSLVRADFEPEEELEACMEVGLMHSLEIYRNGEFAPYVGDEVAGPQRLRMLFVADPEMREAKFAYHFNYFGSLELPALSPALVR
jgi:hypothetical protein